MKHSILSVDEINKLQMENEAYKQSEQETSEIIAELKAELQKFKDMAKKGLDEFKDVGGCWGCGLQLQLNQDLEDIKQLKAENDRLREEVETRDNLVEHFRKEAINWAKISNDCIKDIEKYKQTLQEIKEICKNSHTSASEDYYRTADKIIQKITKAEEE